MEIVQAKTLTYIITMLSAMEAKKPVSKRVTKNQSFQLSTNESWDTMKAQILAQISDTLKPSFLDFANYSVNYYIPRVLPKPGLSLAIEHDYTLMIRRARSMTAKDPILNIVVEEIDVADDGNKENERESEVVEKSKDKKKKVSEFHILLYMTLISCSDSQRPGYPSWKCKQEYAYPSITRTMEMHKDRFSLCRKSLLCQSRHE